MTHFRSGARLSLFFLSPRLSIDQMTDRPNTQGATFNEIDFLAEQYIQGGEMLVNRKLRIGFFANEIILSA